MGGVKATLSVLAWNALGARAFAREDFAVEGAHLPRGRLELGSVPSDLNDTLNVIAAYVTRYAPPRGGFPPQGGWTATFDLIEWDGSPNGEGAKFIRRNRVIGRQAVTRRPGGSGGGPAYAFDQALVLNGFASNLRSTLQCSDGRLPALRAWETDYETHPVHGNRSPLKLSEQGSHREGVLLISRSGGARRILTDRPVVPQWAVWDALRADGADPADAIWDGEFDLLHDLTSYRPRQQIKPCGLLELTLHGQAHRLHGFVQTGSGTQPTHYWIDSAGRPLLTTGGLLSSALVAIEKT